MILDEAMLSLNTQVDDGSIEEVYFMRLSILVSLGGMPFFS